MTIDLSQETNRLIQERMRKGGYPTADSVVRFAMETLEEMEGSSMEELDEQTQAAITRAEGQSERGEGRAWEDVKEELRARINQ